ncbi:putative exonuclease [Vibrio phage 1.170.O._10N.261.52.C3]|nr:putative exonuclease [Vibrio phage 1.170.O._10N.261.52.C3]
MKNLTLYKPNNVLVKDFIKTYTDVDMSLLLENYRFVQCTSTEKQRLGFSPNIIDGEYFSEVSGFLMMTVTKQVKRPNKHLVADTLKLKEAAYLEMNEDKQEVPNSIYKDLKQQVELEVLAATYPDEPKSFTVLIEKATGLMYVEGKGKAAEDILGLIRKAVGTLPVVPYEPELSVADMMDAWVVNEESSEIILGDKVVLTNRDEVKVTFAKEAIYESEAADFIENKGHFVESIQFEYDGVVSATLAEDFTLAGISYGDNLFEASDLDKVGEFIISINEIRKVVNYLIGKLSEEK